MFASHFNFLSYISNLNYNQLGLIGLPVKAAKAKYCVYNTGIAEFNNHRTVSTLTYITGRECIQSFPGAFIHPLKGNVGNCHENLSSYPVFCTESIL
jgi:hypothetical protein